MTGIAGRQLGSDTAWATKYDPGVYVGGRAAKSYEGGGREVGREGGGVNYRPATASTNAAISFYLMIS